MLSTSPSISFAFALIASGSSLNSSVFVSKIESFPIPDIQISPFGIMLLWKTGILLDRLSILRKEAEL